MNRRKPKRPPLDMSKVRNWDDLPLSLTPEEVSVIMNISVQTFYNYCKDPNFPNAKSLKYPKRITREALRRFLESQEIA